MKSTNPNYYHSHIFNGYLTYTAVTNIIDMDELETIMEAIEGNNRLNYKLRGLTYGRKSNKLNREEMEALVSLLEGTEAVHTLANTKKALLPVEEQTKPEEIPSVEHWYSMTATRYTDRGTKEIVQYSTSNRANAYKYLSQFKAEGFSGTVTKIY